MRSTKINIPPSKLMVVAAHIQIKHNFTDIFGHTVISRILLSKQLHSAHPNVHAAINAKAQKTRTVILYV